MWLRGAGGAVFCMALPLPSNLSDQLQAGALIRVNPDGSPLESVAQSGEQAPAEQAPPATLAERLIREELAENAAVETKPRPDPSARKADWVAYAVSTGTITAAAANDLTKPELVARYGK